jgi:CHAD domain-containing protein
LREKRGAQPVLQAIESYKARLRASIKRTRHRLTQFEQQYGVDTAHFLKKMTAEDLEGGDLEYVGWVGEA